MIKLNLHMFGKGSSSGIHRSGSAGGPSNGAGKRNEDEEKTKVSKTELLMEVAKKITNSQGYVTKIVPGFKYNIYKDGELFVDRLTADEVNDGWLTGYKYDETKGAFVNGSRSEFKVRLSRKKVSK